MKCVLSGFAGILLLLTGCSSATSPEVTAPAVNAVRQIDFEAAVRRLAEDELWRVEEVLKNRHRSGQIALNEETLPLTILELTTDAEARTQAVAFRARSNLLIFGMEYPARHRLSGKMRPELNAPDADAAQTAPLRQEYLANYRAELNARLKLRHFLKCPPAEELAPEALQSWNVLPLDAEQFPAERKNLYAAAWLHRAELAGYADVMPELAGEFSRIPSGADFPLKRFAALPSAIAEKRALSPEINWRFAAAAGAAIGIAEEVNRAYADWLNAGATALQAEAELQQTPGALAEFKLAERTLRRDLAMLRLQAECGTWQAAENSIQPRKPAPSEQLAAAWVVEFLLGSGE